MNKTEKLIEAINQLAQAPFPIHDYVEPWVWELACTIVANKKENNGHIK